MLLEKTEALIDCMGFTLLEVLIAIAIMVTALATIFTIEGSSLGASARAKQMNIVAMLAKNKMIETELALEGKNFDEIEKEKAAAFEAPFQDYTWRRSIQELKFPALSAGGGSGKNAESEGQAVELISKLVSNYLSKALREVTVTIAWQRSGKEQTFSVSTYWVDLNHAFELSE